MNDGGTNRKDFLDALARLREGTAEDPKKTGLVVDGVIQRFEFAFEQAWKLLLTMLRHQGFDCNSPRACIKQGFQAGLIADGDGWIRMLDDRDRTSRLYDVKEALKVCLAVRQDHLPLFDALGESSAKET